MTTNIFGERTRLREAEEPAEGHTATEDSSQDVRPKSLAPVLFLHTD